MILTVTIYVGAGVDGKTEQLTNNKAMPNDNAAYPFIMIDPPSYLGSNHKSKLYVYLLG